MFFSISAYSILLSLSRTDVKLLVLVQEIANNPPPTPPKRGDQEGSNKQPITNNK